MRAVVAAQRAKAMAAAVGFAVILCLASPLAAQSPLKPRALPAKPPKTQINPSIQRTDTIVVKFKDDLPMRATSSKLDRNGLRDGRLESLLARLEAGGARWLPVHDVAETKLQELRGRGETNSGKALPDLRTVFTVKLGQGQDAGSLIDELNSLGVVELAGPVNIPPPPPVAPDFEPQQGYLESSSGNGVNARAAWSVAGGNGSGVRVADVEYAYRASHQDLNVSLIGPAPANQTQSREDHGTAVLGILGSRNDGKGTTGIAHGAQIFFSAEETEGGWNRPGAISRALSVLSPGDVLLLEMQTFGPINNELVPAEWEKSVYDVVLTAVANGIVVVAAGGNGGMNLDDPAFASGHAPFAPAGDSGSIIVGAGISGGTNARSRHSFSCYGSTLDAQGWGDSVATTGKGTLYDAEGADLYFRDDFNGTSSASPIVAGSAACLQGSFRAANGGANLAGPGLKMLFRETGRPQTGNAGGEKIGSLPDLAAALPYVTTPASWVSFSNSGPETGSINYPFNSLPEVLASPRSNSIVFVARGTNNYTGKLTNASAVPAVLRSAFGTVKLGKVP